MKVKDKSMQGDAFHAEQVLRPRAQVERQIREAILRGDFSQGDKLPSETDLAHRFGVSRPTVRDALTSLEAAGLIRKIPGVTGGSFVNSVTPASLSAMLGESMDNIVRLGSLDIDELTAMRHVLEVPAASWAAESGSAPQLTLLKNIVERHTAAAADDPEIASYNRDFHITVAHASGNRLLAALVSAIYAATRTEESLCVTPHVGRSTLKQHVAIIDAIRAGSPRAAASAMAEHLEYVLLHSSTEGQGRP